MPPMRTLESFFTAASKRSCQHIENKTAANEGEVGGGCDKNVGGGADKNGMSNFIFSPSTFYFALPPLIAPKENHS